MGYHSLHPHSWRRIVSKLHASIDVLLDEQRNCLHGHMPLARLAIRYAPGRSGSKD